jgi:type I restriction enzyme S subunit
MNSDWKQVKLGELCEVIAGQSPDSKYYNADGNGVAFYQGKKDFGEKFIEAPTTWTTQVTKTAKEGDILMSVRAPVGPVNFATSECCIGRGLAAIRITGDLDQHFLYYQLKFLEPSIAGREGMVFASINKSEIAALPILTGPLAEQKRIVRLLDEAFEGMATAETLAEQKFAMLKQLKASLLAQAFAGELKK